MSADRDATTVRVRIAGPHELASCLEVRRRVFIEEIGVDEVDEIDGEDDRATQFIAQQGERTVGTARLRFVDGCAKAERVAVLAQRRGLKVGRALMEALESEASARGCIRVELHAQVTAVPFYLANGYLSKGGVFIEAGIAHQSMSKALSGDS